MAEEEGKEANGMAVFVSSPDSSVKSSSRRDRADRKPSNGSSQLDKQGGRESNGSSAAEGDASNVCVCVKIRPPLENESKAALAVEEGQQVIAGRGSSATQFVYDAVFGEDGQEEHLLYPKLVSGLVEDLFKGYNATVFAYGQTGGGKTYTMGSEYHPGKQSTEGVIPEAIRSIFAHIEAAKDMECTLKVGFAEIHKEEVRDLLIPATAQRQAVSIRESPGGGVSLCGATEIEVTNQKEMAAVLEMGTLSRATASTKMNDTSSRSHAIFTITLQLQFVNGDQGFNDCLCPKMHFVDLAGSERVKRTKAEGARMQEGIHINQGLLSLGNVINAVVDNQKHVRYRDSKLTRLLQDSLGGNSRTLMIACISPAELNYEETLNTLRYADRARHIRNRPKINRDKASGQAAQLRQMLAAAQNEIELLRRALADEEDLRKESLLIQEDQRKELASVNKRLTGMQAKLELARAARPEVLHKACGTDGLVAPVKRVDKACVTDPWMPQQQPQPRLSFQRRELGEQLPPPSSSQQGREPLVPPMLMFLNQNSS